MALRHVRRLAQTTWTRCSGLGKTSVLFPAAFLGAIGQGMLALGMLFYLREIHGASGTQIGSFFGLWYLCYILGCLLLRPLTDRLRPRYLLIASSSCSCVFPLAMYCGGSLWAAFLFYGLLGLSVSIFWPPLEGWLSSELEGPKLGKVMSRFNISWSSGAILSPYLAGWLSQRGAALPVFAASSAALLTSLLLAGAALALPSVRDDRYRAAGAREAKAESGSGTRLRYAAWIGLFAAYVASAAIANIFPLSAREDLHLSKSVIGALLLMQALFCTLGFGILGHTRFWHYRGSQMTAGQVGTAACLLALLYVRSPFSIGPVLAFMGLLVALHYSNSMFHGMAGSPNRAARGAVHESLMSAGAIAGSLLGGAIYQHRSMAAVYALCAALALAAALAQTGVALWARRTEGPR